MVRPMVLIVDDQTSIRRLLTEFFRSLGWQSVQATNGVEAVDLLTEAPDIILLDMKMPVMDGFETLRRVRLWDKQIPVIMMTAYGELGLLRQAEALGISAQLEKPFDLNSLSTLVQQLSNSEQRQSMLA